MATPKKVTLTMEQRLDVLKDLEVLPVPSIAAKYHVCNDTIYRIKRNATEIRNFADKDKRQKQRQRVKPPLYSELDQRVYSWFIERRTLGHRISDALLLEKASELKESMGSCSNFKASFGWLSKFKKRHDIRLARIYTEQASADKDQNMDANSNEEVDNNRNDEVGNNRKEEVDNSRNEEVDNNRNEEMDNNRNDTENTDEDRKKNLYYDQRLEDCGIEINTHERKELEAIFKRLGDFVPRMPRSTQLQLQSMKLSLLSDKQ